MANGAILAWTCVIHLTRSHTSQIAIQETQGIAKKKKERATIHLAPVEQKAGISRQKKNRTIPRSYWCRGFFWILIWIITTSRKQVHTASACSKSWESVLTVPVPANQRLSTVLKETSPQQTRMPEQIWHKEVGAPESRIAEPLERPCPDAPGFFNLKPGTWAGAPPLRHL